MTADRQPQPPGNGRTHSREEKLDLIELLKFKIGLLHGAKLEKFVRRLLPTIPVSAVTEIRF